MDFKSFLIGFLLSLCLVLVIGLKTTQDKHFQGETSKGIFYILNTKTGEFQSFTLDGQAISQVRSFGQSPSGYLDGKDKEQLESLGYVDQIDNKTEDSFELKMFKEENSK